MISRKTIAFITIVVTQLCWFQLSQAQFQFFGLELGGGGSVKGLNSLQVSLSYLRQVSAHHGFGAELILPKTLNVDRTSSLEWKVGTPWEGEAAWTRRLTPALALRYRYFAGNSFFVGGNLQVGAVREKCFLDRPYLESYQGNEILPIYCDYQLLNPYLRFSGELGLHWPMGKWLFGSILAKGGPQFTFSRANVLGTITTEPAKGQQLDSYHGIDFHGGATIALGVKL
jgi:hypothetical protein